MCLLSAGHLLTYHMWKQNTKYAQVLSLGGINLIPVTYFAQAWLLGSMAWHEYDHHGCLDYNFAVTVVCQLLYICVIMLDEVSSYFQAECGLFQILDAARSPSWFLFLQFDTIRGTAVKLVSHLLLHVLPCSTPLVSGFLWMRGNAYYSAIHL